jgi:DNA processing protein
MFSVMALNGSLAFAEDGAYEPPHNERPMLVVARDGAHLPVLHVAGDAELLSRRSVAVVGSREASPQGLQSARELATELALAGLVVVSGLAMGIDAAAHSSAMHAGGRTIAVVGTPLDRAYPQQHARLQEAIYRDHLLVSPFARGTRTTRAHFPMRNRVMARLSDATVIVEAGETSGTVHQVREAIASGRRVFLAERLFRGGGAMWVRRLAHERAIVVWSSAQEVVDGCVA